MAIKNKTCLCCSAKFSYCPDCSKADALKPSWSSEFCSEDCMTIWRTAIKYNMSKITKTEAKAIIENIVLKPIEQYKTCVQRDLGAILAKDPKPKRGKRAETHVFDEAIAVAVNAEIKEIFNDDVVVEIEPVLDNKSHEVVNKIEE